MVDLRPQPGFQENVLATSADIAIIGGSAGSGKTFLMCMEGTRHLTNPKYNAVGFRRTSPQIRNPGGLWDTSGRIFGHMSGRPLESTLKWKFPSGATISFHHLQHEKDKEQWQGSQIPYIFFDELTHFSESQFFYMVSRNRSDSGIRAYMRASCNPDPDSWVAHFIEWYIDQETGFPIPERAGVIRYFTRSGEEIIWGDSFEEVYEKAPNLQEDPNTKGMKLEDLIKSFTFIPGKITDNQIFLKKDPAYYGNLLSLPAQERAQLLDGNWKLRPDDLCIFEYNAIECIFSNILNHPPNALRCITVDAARFGRDFCVIYVWIGWEVVHCTVFKKSDVHDVVNHIEQLRGKFGVMRLNVVVDQDGVGGGSVKLGKYRGFRGGAPSMKDPDTRVKEEYFNLKTQCYYRFAHMVNTGQVRFNITSENVLTYDVSSEKPYREVSLKVGARVLPITTLIKQDLRAIKRARHDKDKTKLFINGKDEQKAMLRRSPDFGDTGMMRAFLDLQPTQRGMKQAN